MRQRGVGRDPHPFLMAEYQAMQDRLKFLREDLIRTETLTPLAVAAIYSWAFTQDKLHGVGRLVLFWIPVFLVLIAFLRLVSRYASVFNLERYLRLLECELSKGSKSYGYETWLIHGTAHPGHPRPVHLSMPLLRISRYLLWAVMITGSLYLAAWSTIGEEVGARQAMPAANGTPSPEPQILAPTEARKGPSGRPAEK